MLAEAYRLKGEFLLRRAGPACGRGGRLFPAGPGPGPPSAGQSLGTAGGHEPGAAVAAPGQGHDALALLAPLYGWFTEGFDTADFQEAKVLLEELA